MNAEKLLTGADVPSVIALLEGLRVDALGINCGMGPEQMLPVVEEYIKYSSLPVIVKPNAGLPKQRDGHTYYDVSPEEFAGYMGKIVSMGACVIGGCCGTTPGSYTGYDKLLQKAGHHSAIRKKRYDRIFLRTERLSRKRFKDHWRTNQSDRKEKNSNRR